MLIEQQEEDYRQAMTYEQQQQEEEEDEFRECCPYGYITEFNRCSKCGELR